MMEFKILTQPEQIFYKDEGGKRSYLTTRICLNRTNRKNIELIFELYYESEVMVEKYDQNILTIVGKDRINPIIFNHIDEYIDINFRINKVSRRKDGRRFKLYIKADKVKGVFTDPIRVLSKRKKIYTSVSNKRSRSSSEELESMRTQTHHLRHEISELKNAMFGIHKQLYEVTEMMKRPRIIINNTQYNNTNNTRLDSFSPFSREFDVDTFIKTNLIANEAFKPQFEFPHEIDTPSLFPEIEELKEY